MHPFVEKLRDKNNLKEFKDKIKGKKLFSIGKDPKELIKKHKEEISESIKVADRVMDNTFLFRNKWDMEKTNIPYTFEGRVKWDTIANGDLEWCYMLNRHKFFLHLARAYYYTKDDRYINKFEELIESFIDDNHDKNLTWRSIEVGLRVVNWVEALEYLIDYIADDLLLKVLDSLFEHGYFIDKKKNYFTYTSNWGVLEYYGLFVLAIFMQGFEEEEEWLKNSIEVVERCLKNQILSDGSQWEQSPLYHNEILKLVLNIIYLADKFGVKLPNQIGIKCEAMVEGNLKWLKPNAYFPLMGDSDNLDTRDIMAKATLIFGSKKYRYYGLDKIDYELNNLYTDEVIEWYENLEGLVDNGSNYLKDMGLVVSKGSKSHMNFYLKSLGGGHSHDDLLHLSYYYNGKDYLVDSGRYSYVDNEWRRYFKSSLKHNSLMVDGICMNDYSDSWSNRYESQVFGRQVDLGKGIDYAEGSTLSFTRLEDQVISKRKIIHIKEEGVVIVIDYFRGKKEHDYQLNFNFAPMEVKKIDKGVRAGEVTIKNIDNMQVTLADTWYSPEYNLKQKSFRAEFRKRAKTLVTTTIISAIEINNMKYLDITDRLGNKVDKNIAFALELELKTCKYRIFIREEMKKGTSFFKVEEEFYIDNYRVEKVDEDGTTIIK